MGDQRHAARSVRELTEELHHLRLEAQVHPSGGLVEEEQPGLSQQLRGDAGPPPLPSGEHPHASPGVLLQRELLQNGIDRLVDLARLRRPVAASAGPPYPSASRTPSSGCTMSSCGT